MTKRCDTCAYWHPMTPATGFSVALPGALPGAITDPQGACLIGPPERDADTDRGRWPLTLADEYCHAHFPRGEA
jgi:hypothetical protein